MLPPHQTSEMIAVRADGLSKTIDEKPILRDLTFTIPSGQYCALLGANGAGKSTLLKILATLITSTSGTLEMFGKPLRRDSPALRAKIGLIGHQPMLYRDLSARENLIFFGRLYGIPDPKTRAEELLNFVELSARGHDPVKTFSRGMIQRLAIARALVPDPQLLLADEPFAGLDAPSTVALEQMLNRLHDDGRTIILANHEINQSIRLAGRALILRQGRLVLDAPTADLSPSSIMQEICG